MVFLFSFLTLFEFVILDYWTAIVHHANLCSEWCEYRAMCTIFVENYKSSPNQYQLQEDRV